ncbi:hypothetical protein CEXT_679191 [Caerostris extrusa]|uniref:Uncharacterized protein n=1 Tax=Caerostris extrusa TaxID=172846 RepID=A0AAV4R5V7_CAEEX|nr:hypothetical protein CEXT_679191 [Caerostris extrusa]
MKNLKIHPALPNYTIDTNIAPSYNERQVYRGQKTNFGSFEMSHNFDRSKNTKTKKHGNRQRKPKRSFPNASTERSIQFTEEYAIGIDTSTKIHFKKQNIRNTILPFDPNSKHVVQHFSPAQIFSLRDTQNTFHPYHNSVINNDPQIYDTETTALQTEIQATVTPSTLTSQEIELPTIPSDVSLDRGNLIIKQKQEFSRNDKAKTSTEAYYPSDNSAVYSLDAKPNFSTQIINLHSEYAKFSSTAKPTTVTIHRQSKPAGHSKSIISSPLSTIFDTSGENGQYYHYVMNLGQQPAISERSKPKIYSSGEALYKILK